MRWLSLLILGVLATSAHAAQPVTVFLDRNGRVVSDDVTIPRFGGGDRAWNRIVSCVREHYAPFQVDVVERKPAHGSYITAVIGGYASQLGLDDSTTNGVGPHNGRVIPNAVVFIFSKVGTGERDVSNLCSVTAHEVAHSLGLDHEYQCGDIMSYFLDQCGTRTFMDVDAWCGEDEPRRCDNGKKQNSYRRLGELVGFRRGAAPRVSPDAREEPDEPTYDEPTYDEPTYDEPTYDPPTDDDYDNPFDSTYDSTYENNDPSSQAPIDPYAQSNRPQSNWPQSNRAKSHQAHSNQTPVDPYADAPTQHRHRHCGRHHRR